MWLNTTAKKYRRNRHHLRTATQGTNLHQPVAFRRSTFQPSDRNVNRHLQRKSQNKHRLSQAAQSGTDENQSNPRQILTIRLEMVVLASRLTVSICDFICILKKYISKKGSYFCQQLKQVSQKTSNKNDQFWFDMIYICISSLGRFVLKIKWIHHNRDYKTLIAKANLIV